MMHTKKSIEVTDDKEKGTTTQKAKQQ